MKLPLTDRQAVTLKAINAEGRAIFYRKRDHTFAARGRGAGLLRYVPEADIDAMIKHGYIGRQDQRAVWFISERGKIALEEHAGG